MITGDLDRLLAAELRPGITSAGTWRPAPAGAAVPGSYATPVAFALAKDGHSDPARVAAALAATARRAGWVSGAAVTGGGYLTVTVTADALASLAVRITEAGPACARSTALAGTTVPAPPAPDLAAAAGWPQARRLLVAFLTARLAEAAGAHLTADFDDERHAIPGARPGQATGPVAGAIAFAGSWAIGYALARLPPAAPARVDPCRAAAHHLGNPAYAVRYAHAHAASVLRQAADLGLRRGEAAEPRLLAHPSERALLGELSWLAERVAGAARRARPDAFARYLERLADAYLGCQEQCPAVWPGIETGRPETVARLWLAAAAATALRAGLDLLGVDAPDRL